MQTDQFSNKSVARFLRNIAAAQLLKGHNRFRIIAYEKAADTIEHLSREIYDVWQEGKLQNVPGIGPNIGMGLDQYFKDGTSKHFDSLLEGIPPSVFVLMDVPGIGPKKAFRLVTTFGLVDPETVTHDLRIVALADKIAHLEGFGEKSQADIIQALEVYEHKDRREDRMSLAHAMHVARDVIDYLKQHEFINEVDVLGSLRRRVSTIGDIDIAIKLSQQSKIGSDLSGNSGKVGPLSSSKEIVDHFLAYPGKRKVEAAGEAKASILAAGNVRIDLRVQESESYGSMLQYFTGSKAHNIKLRELALKKGWSLNEYGMKKVESNKSVIPAKAGIQSGSRIKSGMTKKSIQDDIITFPNEESLYSFLGLQTPPPEIREGTSEIEIAEHNKLPNLVNLSDIKGDFHIHSSYDLKPSHDLGKNTYWEMMQKARDLGYAYIGFSEHNPKQSGLSEKEIVEIMRLRKIEIERVMKPLDFPYFIGLEVDILPSGDIALPSQAIDYVDYLIVSIHSSFAMPIKDMTERVLRALSQPKVKIFGHPTGRLINKRNSIDLDWDRIFSYVIERDIALEINSGPPRLDLPDTLVKEGKELGATFIINTDAHAVENMEWMQYGVSVARRGWLTAQDVVNTWEVDKVREWMKNL